MSEVVAEAVVSDVEAVGDSESKVEVKDTLALIADDGTESCTTAEEEAFLKWLKDNGGSHEPIAWPSRDTVGGVRGAVALKDIEPGEAMMYIPEKLLISPLTVRADDFLASVLDACPKHFGGEEDRVLTLFLMHEKAKGEESFWAPYLNILPRPSSIIFWSEDELQQLQDAPLLSDAKARVPYLNAVYRRIFTTLIELFPDTFNWEDYPFDNFIWGWMTVQARAFGRRLPYTALVPLADLLNHKNVATKYALEDGFFRLFPSGGSGYAAGTEAFNSYGRRNNRFLLMEYGFSLMDNEWETVRVELTLDSTSPLFAARREVLGKYGLMPRKRYQIRRGMLATAALAFARVAEMTADELKDADSVSNVLMRPISIANELRAVKLLLAQYERKLADMGTTVEEDEEMYAVKELAPRLRTAISYRLTRKRLLTQQHKLLSFMLPMLSGLAAMPASERASIRLPHLYSHFVGILSVIPREEGGPLPELAHTELM